MFSDNNFLRYFFWFSLGFMKALPVPKFKTLLTLGAIAAGVYALKNSQSIRTQFDRAA